MKQCIRIAQAAPQWPVEALGRAQHHLALAYEERGLEGDKEAAESLREESKKVLDKFGQFAQERIRDSGDGMMIFDDLVGTFSGRYTGRHLLRHIQARQG